MSTGPDTLTAASTVTVPSGATGPSPNELARALLPNGDVIVISQVTNGSTAQAVITEYGSSSSTPIWQQTLVQSYDVSSHPSVWPQIVPLANGQFDVFFEYHASGSTSASDNYALKSVFNVDGSHTSLASVTGDTTTPVSSMSGVIALGDGGALFNYYTNFGSTPPERTVDYDNSSYYGAVAGSFTYPYAYAKVGSNEILDLTGSTGHLIDLSDNQVLWSFTLADVSGNMAGPSMADIGNGKVAIAWEDSRDNIYLSLADTAAHTLSTPELIAQNVVTTNMHVLALGDGTFLVDYANGSSSYETFDSTGTVGGGWHQIDTILKAVNSSGQVVGIGYGANAVPVVETYDVHTVSSAQQASVSTSDPNYTAPDGVTTITLTGSNQTIHANNGGDTIWSDDSRNVLIGGTGNDTFHIGRAGDTVTGGGGNDTFAYAEVPWGGSTITDFNSGDKIDLTGLMATTHDQGGNGFAEGYLKIGSDSSGNAQVWANYNLSGNSNWWLVTTLNGVSAASIHSSGNTVLWGSGGGGPGRADTLTARGSAAVIAAPDSGYGAGGYTLVGRDQVDVVWSRNGGAGTDVLVDGYSLAGNSLFQTMIANGNSYGAYNAGSLRIAGDPGGSALVGMAENGTFDGYQVRLFPVGPDGSVGSYQLPGSPSPDVNYSPYVLAGPSGYHVEWVTVTNAQAPAAEQVYTRYQEDFTADGQAVAGSLVQTPGAAFIPYAGTRVGGTAFTIEDNQAQLAGHVAVTLPGEPAHAITEVAAAGLASGTAAAVVWADSGSDYVSIYHASTNSFSGNWKGPSIQLDWGGASDVHVVALPDGGFAVSWMKDGAYKGELFDSQGDGGAVLSLTGEVAGIDSAGDLVTVGLNSSGQYVVQSYAINSPTNVYTADASYTAPYPVDTIHLIGANQTVTASNFVDTTIWSDNTRNTLIGGNGNDTFHIGRAGDTVTGGAGTDTFAFADVPWGAATLTDYNGAQGDVIDLTGLVASLHDPGADPFGDGYLKYGADASGNAQVWANYHQAGNDGWWLVATLDGVSTSSLHYSGGLIT